MTHILERFVIHFLCSAAVLQLALAGFWYLERKFRWWPAPHGWWAYIVPALLSFIPISFREVWDVTHGQLGVKAVTDWISWILGLAVAIWAFYRLTNKLKAIQLEIQLRKVRK